MQIITWESITEGCRILAKELQGRTVWGVPRGGVIVAGILSYMGCKLRLEPRPWPGDVVVDDIADSGKTLKQYGDIGHVTAALFARSCECGGSGVPDHYIYEADAYEYVLFPWEDKALIEARLDAGDPTYQGIDQKEAADEP